MATLKKYNLNGEQIGEVSIDDRLAEADTDGQLVKDYIVALQKNKRQWSASTKTRSEVRHTTRKCGPQKGSGNARHGADVAPQYRGGGRAHGPRPKVDMHVRINKKERRAAIAALLADKFYEESLFVLDSTQMEQPRTKQIVSFLQKLEMQGCRTLFVGEGLGFCCSEETAASCGEAAGPLHEAFSKSVRNVPKSCFQTTSSLNGYDLLRARFVVVTEAAVSQLEKWLCGQPSTVEA